MPRAAPTQPSPSASALASLSTCVGSPVSSARRDRRGKSRHAGMLSGETASPPRAIGPPQPTPHTNSSPRRTAVTSAASRSHIASAPPSMPLSVPPSAPPSLPPSAVVAGVGAAPRSRTRPPPSTRPAASLVPPTSTARATREAPTVVSMECRTLPRRPARPGVSRSAHRVRRDRRNLTWLTHRRREYEAVATSQTAAARGATFSDYYETVLDNIERVIQGKREVIELVLLCLVSEGHLLLEDVPGVGKTNLAKSLATSIECSFGRVQFTPDLLPSDVVGITVWNRGDGSFDFRPGPVFNNIVLADEINRASPKTQAALLEAMAENQVTVDGTTYPLSRPFMVIATQNPIEHEGTYPLPESQLDRFLMRLSVGYPSRQYELEILDTHASGGTLSDVHPVATAAQIQSLVDAVKAIHVAPSLHGYLVDLAESTRRHPTLAVGMSPRATLALQRVSRARAAAD